MTTLTDLIRDFGKDCMNSDHEVRERMIGVLDDDLKTLDEYQDEVIEEKLEDLINTIKERII